MSESGTSPRKLLVIEDDAGLQAQLKWAYDDFEVVIAGDRDSAIAATTAERSPRMSTTSADSTATSVPVPIAMPTSA